MQDRIDEMVNFERPLLKERADILNYYVDKYCNPKFELISWINMIVKHLTLLWIKKKKILYKLDKEYIDEIALKSEGFSARELTKLVISWHDEAFAKSEPILDKETAGKVVDRHIIQYKMKNKWNTTQHDYFKLMHTKNKI